MLSLLLLLNYHLADLFVLKLRIRLLQLKKLLQIQGLGGFLLEHLGFLPGYVYMSQLQGFFAAVYAKRRRLAEQLIIDSRQFLTTPRVPVFIEDTSILH